MIYEIALFRFINEHIEEFRRAFAEDAPLLSRAKSCYGHFLAQGIETPELFPLIVRWHSLKDHTPGSEASEHHRLFMMGFQEYSSEELRVYHIEGKLVGQVAQ